MTEDEYVFEYSMEQLSLQYLFASPTRRLDMIQFMSGVSLRIIAFLLNILLLTTLMHSATLRKNSFYYFVTLICACDLIQLTTSLYNVTYTAFRQAISPSPFTLSHQLIFFVDDAAMWTYICTLAVIALNRVVCVAFPVQFKVPSAHDDDFFYIATFEALFTQNLSKSLVLFCVAAGIAMSLPHLHPCCRLFSFPDWHMTTYYPSDTWYQYLDLLVSSLGAMIIVLSYSLMFLIIRTSANYVFLMSAVNLVMFSMIFWLPCLESTGFVGLIQNTMYAFQNIMNPTIAFIFNKAIRDGATRIFACT
ncbi:hypothetical protein PRIPAC_79129, partial [Pristionchus pacificus]|uniref:G_PROTEIN_RECEP_F1_2 domain-containing protein n=1 Tax=Pristionchus pacificus TaxID=54126 RepID=A0A2A6CNN7_PRIPA